MKCFSHLTHIFYALAFGLCVSASAHAAQTLEAINVEGNQRVTQSAVESYLALNIGDEIGGTSLNDGLKRLYATGFFADVRLQLNDGKLLVLVEENPTVNEVIFEGNSAVNTDDLINEIVLSSRGIYTRPRVQADLKRLLDVYRRNGRYSAEITPKLVPLEQNRVDLVYEISEGAEAKIKEITFIGNEAFSASDLRSVLSSEETVFYAFLTGGDQYDPDRFRFDQELLRRFYSSNGYVDFKVKSAISELSPKRDAFYLTFTIEEGKRYRFGEVSVASSLGKESEAFEPETISAITGEIYNSKEIDDTIDRITNQLGDRGYAFVDVAPKLTRISNKNPKKDDDINLSFEIKEGPKVYVERINIFGNLRTLDEVIRREFRLVEGDAYSNSKLERSEQRLNNLGFFESLKITEHPGSAPDKTQLDVAVSERSTGEITLGAGFSTQDGPLADLGMRERNFLGRGQDVRARVLFSGRRQQYDLGFTEPFFLGREIAAGFDLFRTTFELNNEASFDRQSTGGRIRIGYKLTEKWQHTLRYELQQIDISNVQANASRFIIDQEGVNTTSSIGQSFIYDNRNNRFLPTRGLYLNFSQDLAGFGGDDRFFRNEFRSEYYQSIAKQWTAVFAAAAGHIQGIGEDVGISQRFFIGTPVIRGFKVAGLGPRDTTTNDVLGGNSFYAASAEIRFPLGLPDDLGVSGALFTDIGSVLNIDQSGSEINDSGSLRAALGFGLSWKSPFGPVRINFTLPYLKEDFDDTEAVNFTFGTRF
jgi:outer membrane protein insertion porin family